MSNENGIRNFDYLDILGPTPPVKPLSPELVKELKDLAQKHPINIAVNRVTAEREPEMVHLSSFNSAEAVPEGLHGWKDTIRVFEPHPTVLVHVLKKRDDSGNGKFTLDWGNMKIGFE